MSELACAGGEVEGTYEERAYKAWRYPNLAPRNPAETAPAARHFRGLDRLLRPEHGLDSILDTTRPDTVLDSGAITVSRAMSS